ncbi:hypothetical protein H6F50_07220, partial [Coleofasciculus sp. FACHB-712]|nr:hypothetical protein [Coleofasciculus sp. FACHB-712]
MSNLQNRNNDNREVPQNPNQPVSPHNPVGPTNTVHGNGTVDPGKVTSYRDGYVHGRVSERRVNEEGQEIRDNNNAARGLLIGIALTSLLGLTLGALYFLNQRNQQVEEYTAPAPVVVPVPSPSPSASVAPNSTAPDTSSSGASQQPTQERIIERTTVEKAPTVIQVPQ